MKLKLWATYIITWAIFVVALILTEHAEPTLANVIKWVCSITFLGELAFLIAACNVTGGKDD